jgi:nucleotide-binding universal stress UspA family protein
MIRVVMAGIDVTPGKSPGLNERVVRTAADLAERTGAELRIVHAWCMPGESILASPTRGVSPPRFAGLVRDAARERRERVDDLLARAAPGQRPTATLRKGPAIPWLRWEARRAGADVVVVGNSRRHGLGAILPGNVAEKLVGRVDGSVLSIGHSTCPVERPLVRRRRERRVAGGPRAGSPA